MRGSLGLKNTALIEKVHLDPLRWPLLHHHELGTSSHHFKTVASEFYFHLCPHQQGLEGYIDNKVFLLRCLPSLTTLVLKSRVLLLTDEPGVY
jgi:hypothetical protein